MDLLERSSIPWIRKPEDAEKRSVPFRVRCGTPPIGEGQHELRPCDEDRQVWNTTETVELRNVTGRSGAGLACQFLDIPRPGCYASLPVGASRQRGTSRRCLGIGTACGICARTGRRYRTPMSSHKL